MGAFALPAMALAIVTLVIATTHLTFRDYARDKKREQDTAGTTDASSPHNIGLRYRSTPKR
jgi:hypothetical protein